jgi:hypothetical protein
VVGSRRGRVRDPVYPIVVPRRCGLAAASRPTFEDAGSDSAGRERLLRYCARPPFALQRLRIERYAGAPEERGLAASPGEAGIRQILYLPARPSRDGRTVHALSSLEFLAALSRLIPPPRVHRHRYHSPQRAAARSRWARLLARIYEVVPLTCPDCPRSGSARCAPTLRTPATRTTGARCAAASPQAGSGPAGDRPGHVGARAPARRRAGGAGGGPSAVEERSLAGMVVGVSDLVAGETYFALRHHYRVPHAEAVGALRALLSDSWLSPLGEAREVLASLGEREGGAGLMDRLSTPIMAVPPRCWSRSTVRPRACPARSRWALAERRREY